MRVRVIVEEVLKLETALNKFIEEDLERNEYVASIHQNTIVAESEPHYVIVTLWIKEMEIVNDN